MDSKTRRLTVTRKEGETIEIFGASRITIKQIRSTRVTIEIAAEDQVKILRGELLDDKDPD